MSRRPPQHIEQRVRDLARQHPGWTPSQMAIFLQGEKLKVTSEDVRRVLARPAPTGADAEAPTAERPRYTAPREEQRRSAIPVGLLFGVLFFIVSAAGRAITAEYAPGGQVTETANATASLSFLVNIVVLLLAGAVASRRFASGARAGMIAGGFGWLLTVGVGIALYYSYRAYYETLALSLPDPGDTERLVTGAAILLFVFTLVGLCLGWLGAKIFGRRRRRAAFS